LLVIFKFDRMPNSTLFILAISGSLKATSSNTLILKEISRFANETINFEIYNGLADLPHFNPDKEEGNEAVKKSDNLLNRLTA
jgi:chromate reductase, NAD(P)H dehydrogenase (quinone)